METDPPPSPSSSTSEQSVPSDRPIAIVHRAVGHSECTLDDLEHVTTVDGRTILAVSLDTGDTFVVEYDPDMAGVDTLFELTVQHVCRQFEEIEDPTLCCRK